MDGIDGIGARRCARTVPDRGGQLRGTLTFLLGDAVLDVDAKLLNDRTAFYNPIPLSDPRAPNRSLADLIDPLDGTLLSDDLCHTSIPTYVGDRPERRTLDLADGIHNDVKQLGTHLEWERGNGITLDNRMCFVDAQVDYTALFSCSAPADAASYLATQSARAQRFRRPRRPHRICRQRRRQPVPPCWQRWAGAGKRLVECTHTPAHAV
ncbi:hypothetical protein ADT26_06400 [Xanthomonas oryzae]|nr:hypothetical protein AXO1947_15605 [Xanthomonas oryzae pv. oryzae]KOR45894.1 hypothetical protein ADT26_06400 [Xanthomonas oryzae]